VRQFDQYVVKVDGSGRVTLRNRKFLRKYIPVQCPGAKTTIEHDLGRRWTTPSTYVTLPAPAFSPPLQDQTSPSDELPLSHPTTQIGTSPGARDDIRPTPHSTPGPQHLDVNRQPSEPTSPTRVPNVLPTPVSPTSLPAAVPSASPTPEAGRPARARRPPTWHKDYVMSNSL